jgi:hypothetical protein
VKVVKTPKKGELRGEIGKNVEAGSTVYTDALKIVSWPDARWVHP